jgi:hypothetical protein
LGSGTEVAVADRSLAYQQGGTRTILRAEPAPSPGEWARFVDRALDALVRNLEVTFPTGDTHERGVFPLGIRAIHRTREFSLWCDRPGELIVAHDGLRAQQVEEICSALAGVWSA